LHVLHHYEDIVHLTVWGGDDVVDLGGELVVRHLGKLSEDLDFPDYFLRVIIRLGKTVDKFNSYLLASSFGLSMDHFPVAAYANELDELIVN
jgi:hypothetical protein